MIGKIGKMCIDYSQPRFWAMINLIKKKDQNLNDLWEHLKTQYIFENSSTKQSAFNCLKELDYTICKSVKKYSSYAKDSFTEHTDIALRVKHFVILKLFNRLESFFLTYFTIFDKQAKRNKMLLKLHKLLRNLKNVKFRIKQDFVTVANFIFRGKKLQQKKPKIKKKKNDFHTVSGNAGIKIC